jgi:hypothetical protein
MFNFFPPAILRQQFLECRVHREDHVTMYIEMSTPIVTVFTKEMKRAFFMLNCRLEKSDIWKRLTRWPHINWRADFLAPFHLTYTHAAYNNDVVMMQEPGGGTVATINE